jgi:hypothetical protein
LPQPRGIGIAGFGVDDIAKHEACDVTWSKACTLDGGARDQRSQLSWFLVLERSAEAADRGAGRANDIDGRHATLLIFMR